jgi:hypothetical protein
MPKLVAAYDLGLNSLMLRYNLRYYSQFGSSDPRSHNGHAIRDCLRWIIDDLFVVTPDVPGREPIRQLGKLAGEFQILLADGKLAHEGGNPSGRPSLGVNPIRRLWGKLAALSRLTIEMRPRLYPWYRLGRAMAFCFLDLFDENRQTVLPGFPRLIRAAQQLPRRYLQQIFVLNQLATCDPTTASSNPLAFVGPSPDEAMALFHSVLPKVAVMHKLPKLDRRIKLALEGVPDGPPVDIVFDLAQPFAVFRNMPYPITRSQGLIVEAIIDGDGAWVSGPKMMANDPQLEHANIGREVENLPEPIHGLIAASKHYGFRWLG